MATLPRRSSILGSIRWWYRNWRATRQGAFELQCAGAAELERVARDVGLSSLELRTLVSNPDRGELLAQRMAGIGLGARTLTRSDPAALRDLERVCAMCGFKYRCARDLAVQALDPTWQQWRDYCPNATTLSALGALEACSEAKNAVWPSAPDESCNQQRPVLPRRSP
jgi:hypothetical protein